jgi:hypothetical protein
MARTITDIYDELITEKENNAQLLALQPSTDSSQNLLRDLTSTSKVAIWRLIFFVVAVGIWTFEKILDLHTAEIVEIQESLVTGTDQWYAEQAKVFQLGDTLTWNGVQYVYEVEDEDLQIVEYSSAITENGILRIKVAKDDGSGQPEKLSASELTSFEGYIDNIIFSGTLNSIISTDPDLLKIAANIVYDPLVLASDGSDVNDSASFPVEDAINNYLYNLDFNGILRIIDLIDAIQLVEGVVNVIVTTLEAKPDGGTYADILSTTRQEYTSTAGYMNVDNGFPLSSQLTYLAK